ncbi:isochorismatase family cysteine hydrolase [Cellulosilyticum ruminicola]|uniref:isochorismatase family cysteine hydrolase n=1 Tax=Cellulosilyticum ruminicola TaxID=425254 RepID=UPI0006D29D44|nr:isochorismatase family cysteine hydrolase [Cellulosilyticum ruminicola]
MKILLIVDVQDGYINEFTQRIPKEIEKHVHNFNYDLVIATRFINKSDSLHKSELNMKDMTMLSPHAKLAENIGSLADIVIMKSTYTSLTVDVAKLLEKNQVREVYVAGLNTDTSIMATALELFDKGIKPKILSNLCGTIHGEQANSAALEILKNALGENNIL